MSMLDISKIPMYKFWYDYLKPKYKQNLKLCYMDTDSFIFNVKTEVWYKDISNNIEKIFGTYNIQTKKLLKTGVNKKVLGMMKDEFLNGPKCYIYLQDNW